MGERRIGHMFTIRQLLVDLSGGFDRYWFGGDPFKSAYHNALSMSFPVGEQFFIDSVRRAASLLPLEIQAEFEPQVRGFAAQESTHRRIHSLYNQELEKQGLKNHWEIRAARRIAFITKQHPFHGLAATAALEHFTAVLGDWLIGNRDLLEQAPPALRDLWLWHASEETEHKTVAFDLYQALGGSLAWRRRWFLIVGFNFTVDTWRQTINNLWHGGGLLRPSTWFHAATFLVGRRGVIWGTVGALAKYLRADFHPNQLGDPSQHEQWLAANAHVYRVIGAK